MPILSFRLHTAVKDGSVAHAKQIHSKYSHLQLLTRLVNNVAASILLPVIITVCAVLSSVSLVDLMKTVTSKGSIIQLGLNAIIVVDTMCGIIVLVGSMAMINLHSLQLLSDWRKSFLTCGTRRINWEKRVIRSSPPLQLELSPGLIVTQMMPLECLHLVATITINLLLVQKE